MYSEIKGDLFELIQTGLYDVTIQQTNCFNVQGGGISGKFVDKFGTDEFKMELSPAGDINKLGNIDYERLTHLTTSRYSGYFKDEAIESVELDSNNSNDELGLIKDFEIFVVNAYGQYKPGANTNYSALSTCLKKVNHIFSGKRIIIPQLGCGIGGGDWQMVKQYIQYELKDCDVTVVFYDKKNNKV